MLRQVRRQERYGCSQHISVGGLPEKSGEGDGIDQVDAFNQPIVRVQLVAHEADGPGILGTHEHLLALLLLMPVSDRAVRFNLSRRQGRSASTHPGAGLITHFQKLE